MNMYYLLALVVVGVCAEQVAGAGQKLGHVIKDPCDYFYCAHGGVCILGEDKQSEPTCQCAGDWKGDRCDDSPCQNVSCNTGTCYFDDNGSPHCCCPSGTSGEFCEIIDDPCDDVDCNDGTCTSDENGQTSCSCPESRSGEFCDIITCPQLVSPSNGEVSVEGTTVGSSATYTCDSSTYAVCIHETLTCGNDGEWDKEPPVCVEEIVWDGTYTVSYGGSTYYFSNEKGTTDVVQTICEEEHGGHLLSINSDEEWEFIKCVLSQDPSGDFRIIGLVKNDGQWEWTSGQPITVNYWPSEPTNTDICTVIDDGIWKFKDSETCDYYGGRFICETNNA